MVSRMRIPSLSCAGESRPTETAVRLELRSLLALTSMVVVMMMVPARAMAQMPADEPGAEAPRGLQLDRAGTIQRFGLGHRALGLSDAQKALIDRAADAYAREVAIIIQRYPSPQDARIGEQGMAALMQARDRFTSAVNNVLDHEQKVAWEATPSRRAQAARNGPTQGTRGPGRTRPRQ